MYSVIEIGKENVLKEVAELINSCGSGKYILRLDYVGQPKTIAEWREMYFAIIDLVVAEGATGYRKKDIHSILKAEFLPYLGFNSTKELSEDNWAYYIDCSKKYIREHFNIYI